MTALDRPTGAARSKTEWRRNPSLGTSGSPATVGTVPTATPADLEAPLALVESQLLAFNRALSANDPRALERSATELHGALSAALDHFHFAARAGHVPPALRQRLAQASAQVAVQRESLARATAALDRAIDALIAYTPSP